MTLRRPGWGALAYRRSDMEGGQVSCWPTRLVPHRTRDGHSLLGFLVRVSPWLVPL
jgi:hypothetical protein